MTRWGGFHDIQCDLSKHAFLTNIYHYHLRTTNYGNASSIFTTLTVTLLVPFVGGRIPAPIISR
jgi:hypothetical protein